MNKITNVFGVIFYLIPFSICAQVGGFSAGYAIILLIALAFSCGKSLSFGNIKFTKSYDFLYFKNLEYLYMVAVAYYLINYELISDVFTNLLNGGFGEFALQLAIDRYDEIAVVTLGQQISTILFIYYCSLLGHTHFNIKIYLILIGMIILESVTLSRASVVLGLSAYFVGLVITRNAFFEKKTYSHIMVLFSTPIMILLMIFSFSALMRIQNSENIFEIFVEKFLGYTLAIYDAGLIYLTTHSDIVPMGYGNDTMTFIYKIFGYNFQGGFYDLVATNFGETNVFTIFRGLIYDYGIIITLLIVFASSLFINFYSRKKMGFIGFMYLRCFLYCYFTIIISPFQFTTAAVGFIFAGFTIYYGLKN